MPSDRAHDPAFDAIPQGQTYFLEWRIKDFALVPVPAADYGKFFKGDSYIVICCSEYRDSGHSDMKPVAIKGGGKGYIDIHYWIGSNSSTDEAAVAAIKSVELDDYLGGTPVQHREVEGHESKQFLSYFRNGIRLLNGGFETGFQKVKNEVQPALYQVKGKKRPIMHELEDISWSKMNDGDVFLLIAPKYIFIWTGKKANRFERLAAISVANDLKNGELSRFHLSVVIVDDGQEDVMSGAETEAFNALLSLELKDSQIKTAEEYDAIWTSDEKFEESERKFVHLYQCHESDGKIDVKSVRPGPLTRDDLNSNDTFIVDNGANGEIWVWVGREASPQERSSAMRYAMELIKTTKYPSTTKVCKVIEDGETVEFKSLFKQWSGVQSFTIREKQGRLFKLLRQGKFEPIVNYEQDDLEEDNVMILDAGSKIFVWVGSQLQEKLADESLVDKIVKLYLKQDKSGKNLTPEQIIRVKQGDENDEFKSYFKSWN